MVMRQPAVVSITTSPFPKGPLLVDQPAVIKVFTATSAYDPAVNKLPVFAHCIVCRTGGRTFSTAASVLHLVMLVSFGYLYSNSMSFLWFNGFYGIVSWQWCICYHIVYMYTTWVGCNRNNISIILQLILEKCSTTAGLSNRWGYGINWWWWRGLHRRIVRQTDSDIGINNAWSNVTGYAGTYINARS